MIKAVETAESCLYWVFPLCCIKTKCCFSKLSSKQKAHHLQMTGGGGRVQRSDKQSQVCFIYLTNWTLEGHENLLFNVLYLNLFEPSHVCEVGGAKGKKVSHGPLHQLECDSWWQLVCYLLPVNEIRPDHTHVVRRQCFPVLVLRPPLACMF